MQFTVEFMDFFSERLVLSWQARFLRSNIFSPSEPDMGTAGILKVEVISAKNLRNADIIGASDPYVVVRVGLQSAETNVIEDDLHRGYKDLQPNALYDYV